MSKIFGCLSSLLAVLIIITFIISLPTFYAILAFGDHENWDCYASSDHSITKPWNISDGDVPEDYINVKANFTMVNLWGFSNFMIPFLILFMVIIAKCCCCTSSYSEGP